MSPAHEGQLLGELIVERGLMNDEQLEDALLEQRVSRKRLGAILVASGVISPPDLTAALMAQLGERTGAHPPRSAETAEPIGGGEDHHEPRRGGILRRRRRSVESPPVESGAASVAGGTEERPAKLDPATLELLRDFGAITQSHLADLRQEFEEAGKELEAARIALVARNERIAELEAFLERSDRERRQLAEALRDEMTRTQSKLRVFRAAESAAGPEAEPRPKLAARPEGADSPGRYVLLVPDELGGHALRECAGEPPPVASQIEMGGHRFLVVSHRCSPIGPDDRLCVQLQIA